MANTGGHALLVALVILINIDTSERCALGQLNDRPRTDKPVESIPVPGSELQDAGSLPFTNPKVEEPSAVYYKGAPLWRFPPRQGYDASHQSASEVSNFYIDQSAVGYEFGNDRLPPSADPNDLQGNALNGPLQLGVA